ncbi:hypothetical protein SCUCBS95973_004262 [Sporothrix curviconia]|uniref:Uncharacterized protein n=1 Tax=Sporothrix curviconia TaxID=1260050 RepID=A0ABP0BM58_9PEZI
MNTAPSPHTGLAWRPGYSRQVPWASLGSLVVFMICCVGTGVVLSSSHGKVVSEWPSESRPFSVSVLLSLLVSIANVCLAAALAKAYEISWWLEAIRGAELRRLQFDLSVQSNVAAVFSRSFALNRFTVASFVALAVTVLDGPLIQKASTIVSKSRGPLPINATAAVLDGYLPANWSGYGTTSDVMTPAFTEVSLAYNNRDPIALSVAGCDTANTTCSLDFPGLGFDVQCTETTVPYDFDSLVAGGNDTLSPFKISMSYGGAQEANDFLFIHTQATYKPDAACAGTFSQRSCALRLATVNYPLTLSNGVATMAGWDASRNDTVAWSNITNSDAYGLLYTGSFAAGGFQTMLGGVFLAMNSLYSGNATLSLATMTETPFILYGYGACASNYLTSDLASYGNCSMTWSDPTADYINTARELMLRSVVTYAAQNPDKTKSATLLAQHTTVAATYESAYKYLAAAVASMALEMLVVLVLLHGWRRLGRHVSLDAFEIARALGAPLLQGGSSNSEIDSALAPIERVQLRYGEVLQEQDQQQLQLQQQQSLPVQTENMPYPNAMEQDGLGLKGDGYAMVNVNDEAYQPQPPVRRLGLVEARFAGRIEPGVQY